MDEESQRRVIPLSLCRPDPHPREISSSRRKASSEGLFGEEARVCVCVCVCVRVEWWLCRLGLGWGWGDSGLWRSL